MLTMSITTNDAGVSGRPLAVAQVIRDGGGTAPVELTVAARLRQAGHRVRVYGPPEVTGHARAAGFELEPLEWPPQLGPRSAGDLVPRMIGASVAWARQLAPRLAEGVDVVVADCTAFGALMAARASGIPSAAVMPTVYVAGAAGGGGGGLRGDWVTALAGINRARGVLGLPDVASVTDQVLDAGRLLVLTSRAFELPGIQPPGHVRYVGPQLPQPGSAPPYRLPEGHEPLVLVSLSTSDQGGQIELLSRLLAAIAPLPVRALVTLGPAVAPGHLDPPRNAVLERFVPHAAVLPHTDLVITHGGHGTVMSAVTAGVPLVCVPLGRDQPAVAARVTHHGLGIQVEPDSSVADLRSAISQVLGEPAYRRAAQRMAEAAEPVNLVVDEVAALAAIKTSRRDRR
jgi:MGT family glycosyltransferase